MFSSTDTLGGYFNSGVVKLKWGYICFVRDTFYCNLETSILFSDSVGKVKSN